jgi:hypothetical protein
MPIQTGETFSIHGAAYEVVGEHDGHYHLNHGFNDLYFTEQQLESFPRVRARAEDIQLVLHDPGLER